MKLADLSAERRAWLATARWDRIIEKHEGPWRWRWDIAHDDPADERPDFLTLGGYEVLLPVPAAQHAKISPLWLLPSADGQVLTVFLKNMQWAEWYPGTAHWAEVGFLAICERAPDADWYVAILYHEVFLTPDLTPLRLPPWPPVTSERDDNDGPLEPLGQ